MTLSVQILIFITILITSVTMAIEDYRGDKIHTLMAVIHIYLIWLQTANFPALKSLKYFSWVNNIFLMIFLVSLFILCFKKDEIKDKKERKILILVYFFLSGVLTSCAEHMGISLIYLIMTFVPPVVTTVIPLISKKDPSKRTPDLAAVLVTVDLLSLFMLIKNNL